MAEINQFGSVKQGSAEACERCEAMWMDVLDLTVSTADQAFFDQHIGSCTRCTRMFVDAKRGAAWLEMLREPRPMPSAGLLERILTETTGLAQKAGRESARTLGLAQAADSRDPMPGDARAFPGAASGLLSFPAVHDVPAQVSGSSHPPFLAPAFGVRMGAPAVTPFRARTAAWTMGQRMVQPRLAMTAAMAFFSIALTLNLTGVHVRELRASDLRPANLRKGFHEANAHVVRYYDNLRVVYELEARVHDLQRSSESEGGGQNGAEAPKQPPANGHDDPAKPDRPSREGTQAKPAPGTSRREPLTQDRRALARLAPPRLPRDTRDAPLLPDGGVDRLTKAMRTKGDLA